MDFFDCACFGAWGTSDAPLFPVTCFFFFVPLNDSAEEEEEEEDDDADVADVAAQPSLEDAAESVCD